MNETWPWLTLALLGAYHGINPAMGWLFAVALGLQERRRGAVLAAIAPIALGHAAAIALAVVVVLMAQALVAPQLLRLACASALIGFGVYKLVRRSHPRWVGMRVGFRDLTAWSALMSTAHGAGLMLVPVLLRFPAAQAQAAHSGHAGHAAMVDTAAVSLGNGLAAVGVHTLVMFLVMGAIAIVVFEKVGLAILRRAWFNLDLVWAGALVAAGVITLVL
jgi:hypothetical protein